jgi:hypothetical protein
VGVHLGPPLPFRGCGDPQSDRRTIARLRAYGCSLRATLVAKNKRPQPKAVPVRS